MKIEVIVTIDVQPNEIEKSELRKELKDNKRDIALLIMNDVVFNQRLNGLIIKSTNVQFKETI